MQATDTEVLINAKKYLETNEPVFLITVIKTWGSSPRPVGSIMTICKNGALSGSVSSGCIEEDLIQRVSHQYRNLKLPVIVKYGGTQEQIQRFQLPCGGSIELLIEPLNQSHITSLGKILNAIHRGKMIYRRLDIESGDFKVDFTSLYQETALVEKSLTQTFGPQWKLLIIGAGELSLQVAEIASILNFQITICEPRKEFAKSWKHIPSTLSNEMPDDITRSMATSPQCAVITLSHDPKLDDLALLEALNSSAFYVGALGSLKTTQTRIERLKILGISELQLKKLHAPIGLDIGSKTPAEIAISILAEIISLRNQKLNNIK